jgi:hypothetical protein
MSGTHSLVNAYKRLAKKDKKKEKRKKKDSLTSIIGQ